MAAATTVSLLTQITSANVTNSDPLTCSLFDGDQSKCNIVIAIKRTFAAISLVGCIFMISVIWLFKKYLVFSQRLILYLSIAAFFDSIAYIMGDLHPDGALCDFQAWSLTYFDWSVLLWVCCITFNLYMSAVKMIRTDRFEWAYHIVSWGVPFGLSMLPFIGNHYGPAGMWCWIKDDWKWRFGLWYCPLFLIIALLFFVYTYIFFMINKKVRTWEGLYDPDIERDKQLLKEDVKPLRFYPFVYLAVSIFPLINRIQNAVSVEPVFALVLLHAMSATLQGAFNAILFGLDKETRSRLTIANIKVAMVARYRDESLIREYPVVPESGDPNGDSVHSEIASVSEGITN